MIEEPIRRVALGNRAEYSTDVSKTKDKASRPDLRKTTVTAENEAVIRERLVTYDRDKLSARPWPEVKARLLQHKSKH